MISRFIYEGIKNWMIEQDVDWTEPDSINNFMNTGLEKFGPVFNWAIEEGILDEI